LLTGAYAFRQSGTGILPGDAKMIIAPGHDTIPAVLKRAGYTTGVVGKWHLGLGEKSKPIDWNGEITPGPREVGFDYSFIMAATADRVPCVYVENRRVVGLDPADPIKVSYRKPFPGLPTGTTDRESLVMDWSHGHNNAVINGIGRIGFMEGGKSAIWDDDEMEQTFVRQAISFIEKSKDQPFFLYFATNDIHVPRVPNKQFVGKTDMGPRGDAIAQFDASTGQLVATLERLGLMENTLIVLSSDNGPVLDDGYKDEAATRIGDHKPAGPLRAGKYSRFEGGTRMPFITCWKGRITPGVSDALVSQVDLLASFAALAGQEFDRAEVIDSENHLAALLGESKQGRDSLVEYAGGVALREGDWKFIPPGPCQDKLGPWTRVKVGAPGLLFNLADDPGETKDLAASHPDKLKQMAEKLEAIKSGKETARR
ncbi:sulfatase-like hydrolase/transferase, partial [Luteolibacter marinus]|uniref:sulfatase-like hydrolase/transferase n=1 Tax=Luteolibacter marinus TaxID=2776705 RepID=UPI00186616B8